MLWENSVDYKLTSYSKHMCVLNLLLLCLVLWLADQPNNVQRRICETNVIWYAIIFVSSKRNSLNNGRTLVRKCWKSPFSLVLNLTLKWPLDQKKKKIKLYLIKIFFCSFVQTNNCLATQCLKIPSSLLFSNCQTRKDLPTGHVIA